MTKRLNRGDDHAPGEHRWALKPSITLDVYSHLMTERIVEAADKYDPMQAEAV